MLALYKDRAEQAAVTFKNKTSSEVTGKEVPLNAKSGTQTTNTSESAAPRERPSPYPRRPSAESCTQVK
jgi:hypothetical protein